MIDPALLQGFFNSQTQFLLASRRVTTGAGSGTSPASSEIVPPWDPKSPRPRETERLTRALRTEKFVNFNDPLFDTRDVPEDHKKLFGLYKALNTLSVLSNAATDKEMALSRLSGFDRRFQLGMDQVMAALADTTFEKLTLMTGKKRDQIESPVFVPRDRSQFTTHALRIGDPNLALDGITGTETFTVRVRKNGVDTDVAIDLSQLGGAATISNIAQLMNDALLTAGMVTRLTRTEIGKAPVGDPKKWGFKIEGVSTEQLSFIAASSTPTIYTIARTGTDGADTAQITKLTDLGAAAPSVVTTRKIAADTGAFTPVASKTDGNGNLYVLGTSTGSSGSQINQAGRDMMLRKLDSAGNVIWTKILGASDKAEAAALAVDASGNVVIAGRIQGKIGPNAIGGGWDSVVAKYNADGEEVFVRQTAPVAGDEATSVTIAADGAIYVGGQTKARLAGVATHGGGTDGYLTKLSATGALVYNRQFGGSGEERVARVAVADDGSILVATVAAGIASLAKYDGSNAASTAAWNVSLGNLEGGTIADIAVKNGAIWLGGSTGNASLNAGGAASLVNAHSGGVDGFVMRIDDAGASASAISTTYLGTSSLDRVRGLVATADGIFVTGETGGTLPGATASGDGVTNAFVTRLESNGLATWTRQFGGPGGSGAGAAIAFDANGTSMLDRLGLPRGSLDYTPARTLTARSTLRPGDYFMIAVDGERERRITIGAGETVRSLVNKVNRVLVLDGKASVKRGLEGDQLRITGREGVVIDIKAGPRGLDALAGLGLQPGKIVAAAKLSSSGLDAATVAIDTAAAADKKEEEKSTDNIFGLGLKTGLSLLDRKTAAVANETVRDAMAVIRRAFREITRDPALDALLNRKPIGPAPAYLLAQLGNYQAALARLSTPNTGGGLI